MANSIHVALERIANKDRDFRYMGTSDLLAELNGESFKVDPDTERRVCHVVLQQLDDQSGDISGLAVKCLVSLVRHVSDAKVAEMSSALMTRLTTGKDPQRDIASIALRTLIQETPPGPSASALAAVLPSKLLQGISSQASSPEVKGECLDVLQDVLQRFGTLGAAEQERLLAVLLEQLSSPKPALRKKASQCLASLAAGMSDPLLGRALESVVQLLKQSEGSKGDAVLRSNIQTIAALSRAVGFRFGPVLPEVLPLIMRFCRSAAEQDDEIREYCLQALETFVLRCPHDVASESSSILALALEYLSYDPNFTDDDADAMDEDRGLENGDEEDEDEDDEGYSDDEDMSWKVRRAAAKCLSAIIVSRPEMLSELYSKACPILIERFREREETVKIDVFNTFMDLLKQTGEAIQGHHADSGAVAALLQAEIPKIVKSLNRQLREKSIKTRVGVFSVLKELVRVVPNSLTGHTSLVIPGIQKALLDKTSNSALKVEALLFTRLLLVSHPASTCQPHLKDLVEPVKVSVADRYFKVTSEALRVCGEMVQVMRPSLAAAVEAATAAPLATSSASRAKAPVAEDDGFAFQPLVAPVHSAILSRLTAQDQDQEVKESAICAMALLLAIVPDSLSAQELAAALELLLEKLRNDITRLAAVKALYTVSSSPLHPDMSAVLEPAVAELTAFLRKANRALRQSSLLALNSIVASYSQGMSAQSFSGVITELSPLVSDGDLAMAAQALELCCTVMSSAGARAQCGKDLAAAVNERVQLRALELVKSPLLQGQALLMLQHFFVEQVRLANTSFAALLESILACGRAAAISPGTTVSSAVNRAALSSIAQCAAVLCVAAGPEQCSQTVARLYAALKAATAAQQAPQGAGFAAMAQAAKAHSEALLPLLTLGEIGRRADVSGQEGLEAVLLKAFDSPSEEMKSAASFCLGNIAAGNQSQYLPFILSRIDDPADKHQYLLLLALKEVIACGSSAGQIELGEASVERILALLLTHSQSDEEGVRNVVAECLGKLILIDPATVLPALQARTADPNAFTRATVALALKFALLDSPAADGPAAEAWNASITAETVAPFLMLIQDADRHVRRAAVVALGTAAHNKASLMEDLLPQLLPLLYDQMRKKEELVRTVDLGPFKHEIDDGLDLRKAAFDCMDTLLATCFHRIQASTFITPYLQAGLSDKYDDVKMPCHLILAKLAQKSGPAVLAVLDSLLEPLEKTVNRKVKTDAVKQEADRNEDMVRSALRAVDALSRISNVESSVRFKAFLTKITQTPHLAALFSAIRQEEHS